MQPGLSQLVRLKQYGNYEYTTNFNIIIGYDLLTTNSAFMQFHEQWYNHQFCKLLGHANIPLQRMVQSSILRILDSDSTTN